MVPGGALSASLWSRNVADGAGRGTICVTLVAKCSRWFLRRHYLRHFGREMQQMMSGNALSASLWSRNAADGSGRGIICVTLVTKRCRWFREGHYLRHFGHETLQMVPGEVLSASLWSRNAADGSGRGIICVTLVTKRCRWCRERYYLRHFSHEMMQTMSADADGKMAQWRAG